MELREGSPRSAWQTVLALAILSLALVMRLADLDAYLTIDEPTWRQRSSNFAEALRDRRFADTYQSEHPGVLTMWCGALAERVVEGLGVAASGDRLAAPVLTRLSAQAPGVPAATFWARRIVAFTNWCGLVVLYLLLRRLFSGWSAEFALALVAMDPLLIAFSRLHHLDGLLTTMLTLSVVALLVYRKSQRRIVYLLLSGVFAGLAMANKSPGILLVPWMGAALLWWAWLSVPRSKLRVLVPATAAGALWLLVAAGTLLAVWPALWAAPEATLAKIVAGALRQSTNPHELSNYFWGAIRADPGLGFYPVAWFMRTTPWALAGLVLAVALPRRRDLVLSKVPLIALALGYALVMTWSQKKFDRYLLPVFPSVAILSGIGFGKALDLLGIWSHKRGLRTRPQAALLAFVAATQCAMIWPSRPYYTAYYNPLAGGQRTASRVLLVGWGEGLEQAARYLSDKPFAEQLHVASHSVNEFSPFFAGHATLAGAAPLVEPDFFVLYAGHVQRRFVPEVTSHYFGLEEPEFVARNQELEYAWVYPNSFYAQEASQAFDEIMASGDPSHVVVVLNADAAMRRRYEGPLDLQVISAYPRQDYVLTKLGAVTLGKSRLCLLQFPAMDPDMDRLVEELIAGNAQQVGRSQFGELQATCYALGGAPWVPAPDTVVRQRLGDSIWLDGYALSASDLRPGRDLEMRLHWRTDAPIAARLKVYIHLLGPDGQLITQSDAEPQGGGLTTDLWPMGLTILDDHILRMPADVPAGAYRLKIGLYDQSSMQRLPVVDGSGRAIGDGVEVDGLRAR